MGLSLPQEHPLWKLGRLNHVAIAVPDLEKSRNFYKNVMGAESVSEAVVSDEQEHKRGKTRKSKS